jgi:hypothetical protein
MDEYFVVVYEESGAFTSTLCMNGEALLKRLDECRGQKIMVYTAKCILDWS